VQVKRASIKVETDCKKGVRFYVPATVTVGSGYYDIWLPAINAGTKLGPFAYNEWSEWVSLEPGSYKYHLAAETRTDDNTVYQCDRHRGDFKIECKEKPECPTDSRFDIKVRERKPDLKVITDPCPKLAYFTYEVTTNLGEFELTLPQGCVETSATTGTCKFPVTESTTYHTISGKAYSTSPRLFCGSDSEQMEVEGCKECRSCENYKMNVHKRNDGSVFIGDVPTGMYYTINGGGHYHEAQILDAPDLDCEQQGQIVINLYDEHCSRVVHCQIWTFRYVGECECEDLELQEGCYPGNVDNVAQFKRYFNVPSDYCINRVKHIGQRNRACIPSPINADWAVVKGGPQFRLYVGVQKGQSLCTYCPPAQPGAQCKKPNISHISWFRCCREQ
jgi:hypothetical protein